MQVLLLALGLALSAPVAFAASVDEVKAQFAEAFTKGESTDKKAALRLAQGLGKDQDDVAFELLIKGVNDRQVHDEAVLALRARTGLQPTLLNRGSGYPGYPASDDASEWNNWLSQRKKDKETQQKLAEGEKKLKELEEDQKKADDAKNGKPATGGDKPAEGSDKPGDPATATTEPGSDKPAYEPPSDLGRLDRIVFKTGGSLVCYVLSKRVNADGVLQSVRIVHQNDGGEETLAADLIARIDEDVR
ncbi:MAG: hypothetical protein H0W78_06010 [Planctomycetes bacterium]|jgi:hypothetical protein|nr:hypothetical protein [Planctomycetota bacterium]